MKRLLFSVVAIIICAYGTLFVWNVLSLRVGVYNAVVLPIVQIPWSATAYLGLAFAHKGVTLLTLGAIVAVITGYHLRRRTSNRGTISLLVHDIPP